MTIRVNEEILNFIDTGESFFIEFADVEASAMPQTAFNPMPVSRVISSACVKITSLTFMATEEAVVCFPPIKRLIVPFVQINNA